MIMAKKSGKKFLSPSTEEIEIYDVYVIRNRFNGRVYVGSTKNFSQRKSTHFSHLKFNKHKNRRLQKDYIRYGGRGAFDMYKVCNAPSKEIAYKFEQILIDGSKNPYNILIAGGATGRVYMPSTIKKMSEVGKNRVITSEQIAKMAATKKGSKLSESTKRNMSVAHKKRFEGALKVPHSKLPLETVYKMYELYDRGLSAKEVSRVLGVNYSTTVQIVGGRAWKAARKHYYESIKITDKGAIN